MVQSNARFKIDIYGDTANFENSLKGVNSAVNGLKGEAAQLRRELKLDPGNNTKLVALQKNLQQQLSATKQRAVLLRQELSQVDKSTPAGQNKYVQLQRQLKNAEIQAGFLEKDLAQVDNQIKNPSKFNLDTSGAVKSVENVKQRFSALRETAIGVFRQIGSSIASSAGRALGGLIEDTKATQKANIALKNTLDFSGIGKDYDGLSKRLAGIAAATNANTEDTVKLGTTFVGLGNSAQEAGDKVEAIVKANQAFGGTGENLKGVTQAYSQISASGKVGAENINQLTDNNTALGAALKKTVLELNPALKQYGSFANAAEKGAVTVDMLDQAIQKLGQAGGGGVETIDDSLASLQETLSLALLPILDAITPLVTSIINSITDRIPAVSSAIQVAIDYFTRLFNAIGNSGALDLLGSAFESLGRSIGIIVGVIEDILVSLGILPSSLDKPRDSAQGLADAFLRISGNIEKGALAIESFLKSITDTQLKIDLLKGSIIAIAGGFAALKVISIITGLINGLAIAVNVARNAWAILSAVFAASGIGTIITLVAALVAGLVYFFTQTETGTQLWATFVQFLQDLIAGLVTFFQNAWASITQFASNAVTNIQNFFAPIVSFFSGLFSGIASAVSNGFNAVVNFASNAVNAVYNFWKPLINFYASIFNLIGSIVNVAFQLIFGIARTIFNNIVGLWSTIGGIFSGIFNFLSSVVAGVFNAILGYAQRAFQGMYNTARNIINALVSVFRFLLGPLAGVFNAILGYAQRSFQGMYNIAAGVVNAITGAFSGIVGFFSNIFGAVASIASNVLGGITNTINNIAGAINGVAGKIKGFFGGAMVAELREVSMASAGFVGNSATAQTSNTANTFNIQAGALDITQLARAIKREIDNGRA